MPGFAAPAQVEAPRVVCRPWTLPRAGLESSPPRDTRHHGPVSLVKEATGSAGIIFHDQEVVLWGEPRPLSGLTGAGTCHLLAPSRSSGNEDSDSVCGTPRSNW